VTVCGALSSWWLTVLSIRTGRNAGATNSGHTASNGDFLIMTLKKLAGAGLAVCVLALTSQGAFAEMLFKVVTVKDEIVVGLNDAELKAMGGDAAGVAKELASKGTLSVWQYAVKQAADGERQMAPMQKIGLLAHTSVRIEPYKQPFKVLPHD
jgi:hypothetical protein